MPFDGSSESLFGFLIVFSLNFFCAGFDDGLSAEHFDYNLRQFYWTVIKELTFTVNLPFWDERLYSSACGETGIRDGETDRARLKEIRIGVAFGII